MISGIGPLGFGAAAIGNLFRAISDDEAQATIAAAWTAGLRYFDTAPHYGFGLSEKRLGEALALLDPRGEAIISTKVGRRLDPFPEADLHAVRQGFLSPEPFESRFDYSHDAVMRSHEQSLKRLKRERIDILYAHDIGRLAHGADHPAQMRAFLDGGFRAMRRLRDEGAVRAIGIGVNEVAVCEEMLTHADIDILLLAGRYTLLQQEPLDRLFPLCVERGVQVVIGGPYNSGILARSAGRDGEAGQAHYEYGAPPPAIVDRVQRLDALCASHGVPLGRAALHFPLRHPVVGTVVAGFAGKDEVDAAIAHLAEPVPGSLWAAMRDAGLIDPRAPV
ncbi:aldo/keto reductase [Sphingobium aromaticiconvertens]|uniref:aldo/keto reductase n=1 Tax=Sphingobium aromaticiconvertens TaxID=365341 RepID=UPI0030195DB6